MTSLISGVILVCRTTHFVLVLVLVLVSGLVLDTGTGAGDNLSDSILVLFGDPVPLPSSLPTIYDYAMASGVSLRDR